MGLNLRRGAIAKKKIRIKKKTSPNWEEKPALCKFNHSRLDMSV